MSLSYPCRLDLGKVPGLRPIADGVQALGLGSGYAMFGSPRSEFRLPELGTLVPFDHSRSVGDRTSDSADC